MFKSKLLRFVRVKRPKEKSIQSLKNSDTAVASNDQAMVDMSNPTTSGSNTQLCTPVNTSLSVAQRCMSLYFALCTKKHTLLRQVFDIYKRSPDSVKQEGQHMEEDISSTNVTENDVVNASSIELTEKVPSDSPLAIPSASHSGVVAEYQDIIPGLDDSRSDGLPGLDDTRGDELPGTVASLSLNSTELDDINHNHISSFGIVPKSESLPSISIERFEELQVAVDGRSQSLGVEYRLELDPWTLLQTHILSDFMIHESAVHHMEEVRMKAIRLVANKLYPLPSAVLQIEEFAKDMSVSIVDGNSMGTLENVKPNMQSQKVTDACNSCFERKQIFTQQVIAKVLNHLVEQIPLPLLFMRTVLQAIGAFPALVDFIMDILGRLVNKQIWKNPKLWVGFLKCAQLTQPHSFSVLLQLPQAQLEGALKKIAALKAPLAAHASQPNVKATVPRSILVTLGLASDSHVESQSQPGQQPEVGDAGNSEKDDNAEKTKESSGGGQLVELNAPSEDKC